MIRKLPVKNVAKNSHSEEFGNIFAAIDVDSEIL
jgi:hypothetical protein